MGGDLFEGTQKLTNSEYQYLTQQLVTILHPFCKQIEPYTPIPQKQIHGDIDLIVLLKQNFNPHEIISSLKLIQYKINNGDTMNTVYRKKQVDFCFVKSKQEFDMVWFYKSYSGLGGYLGVFFPSKIIKLTHKGLFAPICYFHLKVEVLISDDVGEIMKFYGLDYERHKKGYQKREQMYEYLRTVRFLDEVKYVEQVKQVKGTSKLMWGMVEHIKQTGIKKDKHLYVFQDILKLTLEFFDKTEAYNQALNKLVQFKKKNEEMNKKFNARHILEHFDIPVKKQVDHMKVKFKTVLFNQDEEKYLDYVDAHQVKQILEKFREVCGLKVREKDQYQEKEKNSAEEKLSKKSMQKIFKQGLEEKIKEQP